MTTAPLTLEACASMGANLPGRCKLARASRWAQAARLRPAAPLAMWAKNRRRCRYTPGAVISLARGCTKPLELLRMTIGAFKWILLNYQAKKTRQQAG